MKWYPLQPLQIVVLLVLAALIDIFTILQKPLLPDTVRPFTYLLAALVLILAYFFYVKPDEPMVLASTLAVVLFVLAFVVVLVQNVIIAYTVSWRTIFTFIGAIVVPFVVAYMYEKIRGPASGK
jgi:hypothetical protein